MVDSSSRSTTALGLAMAIFSTVLLTACGGGGTSPVDASPEPSAVPEPTPSPPPTRTPAPSTDPTPSVGPGQLDPAFGDGGIVRLDVGGDFSVFPDGYRVDDQGGASILLCTHTELEGETELARVRIGPNGQTESVEIDSLWTSPEDLLAAFTPTGDILAATTDRDDRQLLARLTPEGLLDPTFGVDGFVEVDLTQISALFPLADGTILLGGHRGPEYTDPGVLKIRANGSEAPDFGDSGFAPAQSAVTDIAVDSTGRIFLLVYEMHALNFPGTTSVEAHRPDGSIDESFGIDGIAGSSIGFFSPRRRVYVAPSDNVVTLDDSIFRVLFGGRAFENPQPLAQVPESSLYALAFHPDSSFVVVGARNGGIAVAAFTANGREEFLVELDLGDVDAAQGEGIVLAPPGFATTFGVACSNGCKVVVARYGVR